MDSIEIKKKIVLYGVSISRFAIDNIDSGLLTMNRTNELTKNQVLVLSQETEVLLKQFVNAFTEHTDLKFEKYEANILFQYVFDKTVEVTYKVITDAEIDTEFIPAEPYEYHEPDLPEYIQLKLTNAVSRVGVICCKTIDFIDRSGFRSDNLNDWMLPLLLVAAYVGIEFAQEMDLEDDSELKAYLEF